LLLCTLSRPERFPLDPQFGHPPGVVTLRERRAGERLEPRVYCAHLPGIQHSHHVVFVILAGIELRSTLHEKGGRQLTIPRAAREQEVQAVPAPLEIEHLVVGW